MEIEIELLKHTSQFSDFLSQTYVFKQKAIHDNSVVKLTAPPCHKDHIDM